MLSVSELADQVRSAFLTRDVTVFGSLLADDCVWGDPGHPRGCRNSAEVIATFTRLLNEVAGAEVTEVTPGSKGILCGLHVQWPEGVDRPEDRELFHTYLVADGKIQEIRRFDDRSWAAEVAGVD